MKGYDNGGPSSAHTCTSMKDNSAHTGGPCDEPHNKERGKRKITMDTCYIFYNGGLLVAWDHHLHKDTKKGHKETHRRNGG